MMTTTPQTPVDALMTQARDWADTMMRGTKSGYGIHHETACLIAGVLQQCANHLEASARALAAMPECTCPAKDMPFGRCCKAQQAGGVPAGLSEEYPAPYRCLKPHCPLRCSGCNHAIPVTDTPKMIMVKLLDELAVDERDNPYEEGDSKAVDAARAWLCAPSPSAVHQPDAKFVNTLIGLLHMVGETGVDSSRRTDAVQRVLSHIFSTKEPSAVQPTIDKSMLKRLVTQVFGEEFQITRAVQPLSEAQVTEGVIRAQAGRELFIEWLASHGVATSESST